MNATQELEPRTRNSQIIVRVTDDLKQKITDAAKKRKVKAAWLVRFILLDWLDEQTAKKRRSA